MNLTEIVEIVRILNKGKNAFTADINICYDVVRWYREHGTIINFEQQGKSICMWEADKN